MKEEKIGRDINNILTEIEASLQSLMEEATKNRRKERLEQIKEQYNERRK